MQFHASNPHAGHSRPPRSNARRGTVLESRRTPIVSGATRQKLSGMTTCLTLLLALTGCGDNAFSPQKVEIAAIQVASAAQVDGSGSPIVAVGGTLALVALDENGNELPDVEWSTSDILRAGISGRGVVNGLSAGDAVISAAVGGRGKGQAIRIEKGKPKDTSNGAEAVGSVSVSPSSYELAYGGTVQLKAEVVGVFGTTLTDRPITWSTNNTAIATVSSSGVVTATGSGSAQIAATSEGQSDVAVITIAPPQTPTSVGSVTVSPSSSTVSLGESLQLSATVKSSSGETLTGQTVTWSTSNSQVATVSSGGVVTAKAGGYVKISAASGGKSGSAEVVVPTSGSTLLSSAGGEPQAPAVGSSSLLFDYRRGSTMAAGYGGGFATAGSMADVKVALGGGNYTSGWGATLDVDGKGTRALMGTYWGPTDCNAQQEHKANLELARSVREVYFSYMTRLGRSSTGEGVPDGAAARGDVNAFRAQSANCDGKGGKRFRVVHERVTFPDGSTATPAWHHQWRGGATSGDVAGDIAGEPGAQIWDRNLYSPERLEGRPVRYTVYARASTALSGSMESYKKFTPDGVVRVWVDGVLVFDRSNLVLPSSAINRVNLMSRLNSPSFEMTDYWWDMVAWQP